MEKFFDVVKLIKMITNSSFLLGQKITRCGAIPFTLMNGDVIFLLAKDRITKELGDFGGGAKRNEKALHATMREFEEESKGIFKQEYDSIDRFKNAVSITHKDMAITFLPIEETWYHTARQAFKSKGSHMKDEVCDIVWVDRLSLFRMISETGRKSMMWSKVRKFFSSFTAGIHDILIESLRRMYTWRIWYAGLSRTPFEYADQYNRKDLSGYGYQIQRRTVKC